MRRLWIAAPLALVTVAAGCGMAGADSSGVPESVMLQAEDLGGTRPDPGGPDPAAHPLPPMPCPMSSARLAVEGLDVPRGSDYDARHCDGTWMVVEVNETAGACGPRDGGQRPGCTVTPRVRRWFLKHGTRGWTPLAATQDAGCGPVHAVEPAFPRHLCANLPAM